MSGKSSKRNRTGNERPASQDQSAREQKRAQFEEPRRRTTLHIVLASLALLIVAGRGRGDRDHRGDGAPRRPRPRRPPAATSRSRSPTSADGKAHFYSYDAGGTQVKYFVLKSSDGKVRAAFDACDVCFAQKKGYQQEGDEMVCGNCGQPLPVGEDQRGRGRL